MLFRESEPLVGLLTLTAVNGLLSESESFPSTPGAVTVRGISSLVEYESLLAKAGSLTGFTVMVTVATLLSKDPSFVL